MAVPPARFDPCGDGRGFSGERMESSRQHAGMAVERAYRFVLWLTPTVEKFPRAQKYLLGDRMQSLALDVLEDLIEATYSRARQPSCNAPICAWKSCASGAAGQCSYA